MNPIVPGTYTLSKIEASINGVRFEIANQDPDTPIQITAGEVIPHREHDVAFVIVTRKVREHPPVAQGQRQTGDDDKAQPSPKPVDC